MALEALFRSLFKKNLFGPLKQTLGSDWAAPGAGALPFAPPDPWPSTEGEFPGTAAAGGVGTKRG